MQDWEGVYNRSGEAQTELEIAKQLVAYFHNPKSADMRLCVLFNANMETVAASLAIEVNPLLIAALLPHILLPLLFSSDLRVL